jgi:hypothetical protein
MNMRWIGILAIFTAALTASAQPAATFEWTGAIHAGQTLEIRNVIGDIRAEAAAGADIELSVRVYGTNPDPNSIRIDVVQHDGGVLFCTIYQGLSDPDHCTPERTPSVTLTNSNIRVQYRVRVPAGVSFVPRTVNGNISADLAESPITAATVNGRIVLTSGKTASATVVNGSIVATLANVDWSGSREFTAVNGSIDLEVPEAASASVKATTVWGALGNDFGIPVHRMLIGSWFDGDINGGGSKLVMTTVNGSIHLRKSPAQ